MSLASEKFEAAALALARSGPIKQRLVDAYLDNLIDLDAQALPEELQQEFGLLCESLNRVAPLGNEGRVIATVRKMSEGQVDACAQRIVVLFGELARAEARSAEAGEQGSRRYIRSVG